MKPVTLIDEDYLRKQSSKWPFEMLNLETEHYGRLAVVIMRAIYK